MTYFPVIFVVTAFYGIATSLRTWKRMTRAARERRKEEMIPLVAVGLWSMVLALRAPKHGFILPKPIARLGRVVSVILCIGEIIIGTLEIAVGVSIVRRGFQKSYGSR